MTTAINKRMINERLTRAAMFCLLAFAAVLYSASEARAQWVTNGNNINNTNTGSVGVGTADPSQGGVVASKFTIATPDDTSTAFATSNGTVPRFALNHRSNGSWTMYDYAGNLWNAGITQLSGKVGIGTNNPGSHLHIEGSVADAFAPAPLGGSRLIIQNNNQTNGTYSDISFRTLDSSGYGQTAARITGIFTNHAFGGVSGDLAITTMNTMTRNEVARFTSTGNVGIGTTTPTSKLHVAGDIKVDGNIAAKYQDVAEWVPSTQALAAGTVVALDTERANHVVASASAYDTRVAGVISAQPGIALGDAGQGKVLVATTGRVKIKVDAARAPIRIGDLLVTSDVAGVAMKSEPIAIGGRQIHAPGTIIGKALESLEKGAGEILVLLSLQ